MAKQRIKHLSDKGRTKAVDITISGEADNVFAVIEFLKTYCFITDNEFDIKPIKSLGYKNDMLTVGYFDQARAKLGIDDIRYDKKKKQFIADNTTYIE